MILADERRAVCEYARRLTADGLVVGTSGNISARSGELIAVTPTGVDYGVLTPEDIPVVSLDGSIVEGKLRPTSEMPMHLSVYTKAADPAAAWWEQEVNAAVSPDGATVTVAGVTLGKGSRVRLRPRARGTDAHDMFLDGRTGRVEKVLVDVDGTRFLAVTVDDDPGADLHHWYGRLRHFRPEEVEPLPSGEVAAP